MQQRGYDFAPAMQSKMEYLNNKKNSIAQVSSLLDGGA